MPFRAQFFLFIFGLYFKLRFSASSSFAYRLVLTELLPTPSYLLSFSSCFIILADWRKFLVSFAPSYLNLNCAWFTAAAAALKNGGGIWEEPVLFYWLYVNLEFILSRRFSSPSTEFLQLVVLISFKTQMAMLQLLPFLLFALAN